MRVYSTRERILAGLTVPIWLAVVVVFAMLIATMTEMRTNLLLWAGGLGGVGATFIAVKIAVSGRSTRGLEQNAFDALSGKPLPPDQ
jgi:hypothetical protein